MVAVKKSSPTRVGVVFSSGFFGFFAHAGFLEGIRELGLRPVAYAGASSGAIVGAMAASDMEDKRIKEILFGLKKEDFWDPDPWPRIVVACLRLFRGYTGYLKGERFYRLLGRQLRVRSFEQCAWPLAIVATNLSLMREEVFTQGDLLHAVAASGAVPGFFRPVRYRGCLFVDGGVVNKAPVLALCRLTELDKVIVHFMDSGSFSEPRELFLRRWLTPWHIHIHAVDIARKESYRWQCELATASGVEVVEVRTRPPSLGPNSLDQGPEAFYKAKADTVHILSSHLNPSR
ncbi:MAG: patatin-like phospholipase family protein [Deltaproteobacteria bacterium]|nr:patatin-like phospholipase family protein [Deltaproteobacteria bacterium]MBW1927782.1 patatin-like phospholipase family protein [Deltaproteobacteria bacterium]MBW2024091.1 patatin-like phospholipase family protein [Deltaproteobacteria bacterium]MBW2124859.1 patatin-like phospholipase family protein [Deltaproteobacteria bacterium]